MATAAVAAIAASESVDDNGKPKLPKKPPIQKINMALNEIKKKKWWQFWKDEYI